MRGSLFREAFARAVGDDGGQIDPSALEWFSLDITPHNAIMVTGNTRYARTRVSLIDVLENL